MNVRGRTFSYVVKKAEEGGYTARCIELPQVHTEGATLSEVKRNMRDALTLTMDYLKEQARKDKGEILEITVR